MRVGTEGLFRTNTTAVNFYFIGGYTIGNCDNVTSFRSIIVN